jgi:hypothetical protein
VVCWEAGNREGNIVWLSDDGVLSVVHLICTIAKARRGGS